MKLGEQIRKNSETGLMELWRVGETYTKGYIRGTESPDVLLHVYSPDEWAEIQMKNLSIEERERLEAEERREALRQYEAYVDSLPASFCGLTRRDKVFEDEYGNYISTVPRKASLENWDLQRIEAWLMQCFENC